MYRYIPFEEMLNTPELGTYRSYGIRVICEDHRSHSEPLFVSDVSVNFEVVCTIAARCTAHRLDPIHLISVIEDAIG